ncbi:asparagine synthase (glutamine-hydrolyzing) [Akkermansiaceae bacterium]|nr:asparagine synthase (glutamine-hydrolyzing) [Akkermansiaceae bacterium]
MCGITGFLGQKNGKSGLSRTAFVKSLDSIEHRGPDSRGHWFDLNDQVGLGHTRLSILDLSKAGNQPMHSSSGNLVLVFNGEIYNHLRLRKDIEKARSVKWAGTSDTETLLAGFELWGVGKTLERCEGMFAFGLYNKKTKILLLGRDRIGEKPLYYGKIRDNFVFASELRPFYDYPGFSGDLNFRAVKLYFRHSYIPCPHTIFKGFHKLLPGHLLEVKPLRDSFTMLRKPFWQYAEASESGKEFRGNKLEVKNYFLNMLKGIIEDQMNSDVPVGTFLSGGIDSTLVTSIASEVCKEKMKTFTIGFEDATHDESTFARKIANHLRTEHTDLMLSTNEVIDLIPEIASQYDEPFGDSSQVPTYAVAKMTREFVTVALSGDGGDELFGGYQRYQAGRALWSRYKKIKRMALLAPAVGDWLTDVSTNKKLQRVQTLNRLKKEEIDLFQDFYEKVVCSHDLGVRFLSKEVNDINWKRESTVIFESSRTIEQQMMDLDVLGYLPDDILAKVDRAAMAVSLETRVPFLNHRIVEFAAKLPLDFKIQGDRSKWLLTDLLKEFVPKTFFERPKQGFGLPLSKYIRGPLRLWAEDLLQNTESIAPGVFDKRGLDKIWRSFVSGNDYLQTNVWDALMFLSWKKNLDSIIKK